MWTDLRIEIEHIRKTLNFTSDQFKPLRMNDWQIVEEAIYDTFCKLPDNSKPVWLWEYLKKDAFSIQTETPFIYLTKLINENTSLWFFVNETVNEQNKFWFYQGQLKPIERIISQASHMDEFYLVSKTYNWLIGFNHHGVLFSVGETVSDNLRKLKATNIKIIP